MSAVFELDKDANWGRFELDTEAHYDVFELDWGRFFS
jgi:hypothetical protein